MRRLLRLLRWPAIVLGALLLLAILAVLVENARGSWELRAIRGELARRGESLVMGDSMPKAAPEALANGRAWLELVEAQKSTLTREKFPILDQTFYALGNAGPARARALTLAPEPELPAWGVVEEHRERPRPPRPSWDDVAMEVAVVAPITEELRTRLAAPIAFEPTLPTARDSTRVSSAAIKAFRWLKVEAVVRLRAGDHAGFVANVVALRRLGEATAPLPGAFNRMLPTIATGFAASLAWCARHHPGWTEADLAALQAAFAGDEPLAPLLAHFTFERASLPGYFRQMRADPANLGMVVRMAMTPGNFLDDLMLVMDDDPANDPPEWDPPETLIAAHAAGWWLLWAGQDEAHALRKWTAFIDAARLLDERGFAAMRAALPPLRKESAPPSWRHLFSDAIFDPGVQRSFLAHLLTDRAVSRLARTAIALTRHRLAHGAYPETLEQLVPTFLPAVPLDPYDGQPLRYRRTAAHAFRLYAVGFNGTDDGGSGAKLKASKRHEWTRAKDIVWPDLDPSPAPPPATKNR